MHDRSIAHRDIKLDNLLYDASTQKLKIIDFGFSLGFEKGKKLTQYCGTVMYSDPDLQQKKSYCPFAADVWASGVTFYLLLTGKWPFDGDYEADFKAKVMKGAYEPIKSTLF